MDTKSLRQKILNLAVRGKLVPQDPNDEPASVLLEHIRAQKQQMVKDGKLKAKDIKNDTVIFVGEDNLHYEKFADGAVKCIEDEIPFEIPKGWEWCRLGFITSVITDYVANGSFASLKQNVRTYKEKNFALFVRTVDFANNFERDLSYIDKASYDFLEKSKLFGGELMLSNIGASIGKVFKVPAFDIPMSLAPNSIVLRFFDDITSDYFEYVFKSFVGQDYLQYLSAGAAMPKFNKTDLRAMVVPIPPLKEQAKIVKAIQILFLNIDNIDSGAKDLTNSIQATKAKILDLAIRGKLVPQDPNDEPASVLLERIRAEKEELIKRGKIKRDKKGSVIFKDEDNSYYKSIPENWSASTLDDITTPLSLNDGDWILSENMDARGTVKLIQLGSIGEMRYIDKGFKFISTETFHELKCTQIYPGFVLINRIISNTMNICILPDIEGPLITTVDTCWIAPNDNHYNAKYLMFVLASPTVQANILLHSTGTTRKRISKNNLIKIAFPLPPLAEQKRIVSAIETYFSLLDEISQSLL